MNHEKSRKHKENVAFLRLAMEEEEEQNGSSSGRENDEVTPDMSHDAPHSSPGMSHDMPDMPHDVPDTSHDIPDCSTLDDIMTTKDTRTEDSIQFGNNSTSDVEKTEDDDDDGDSSNMAYVKR